MSLPSHSIQVADNGRRGGREWFQGGGKDPQHGDEEKTWKLQKVG